MAIVAWRQVIKPYHRVLSRWEDKPYNNKETNGFVDLPTNHRDQSRYALSQWEMSLQCNDISHWLSAYLDWSLYQSEDKLTRNIETNQTANTPTPHPQISLTLAGAEKIPWLFTDYWLLCPKLSWTHTHCLVLNEPLAPQNDNDPFKQKNYYHIYVSVSMQIVDYHMLQKK